MFSRIGFTALLRGSAHRRRYHKFLRAAPRRLVTTPPSPFPPGLVPPSPVPPPPAPTHHITLPSRHRRQPCWPSVTHTIKRYLVAKLNPQVSPLLSEASDRPSKRSSVVR